MRVPLRNDLFQQGICKKAGSLALLVLLTAALQLFSMAGSMAATASKPKLNDGALCKSLFVASPGTAVVVVEPRSAIVVRSQVASSDRRDITLMLNSAIPGRAAPLIASEYIKQIQPVRTSEGDFIDVQLYSQGSPYLTSGPNPTGRAPLPSLENNRERTKAIGFQGSTRSSTGRELVLNSRSVTLTSNLDSVSDSDSRRLVYDLISSKDAPEARLSSSQINRMVDLLHREPDTLKRAIEYAEEKKARGANFIADAPVIHLSNVGINRYFRFQPRGTDVDADARVLDLNRKQNPESMNILIEWTRSPQLDNPRIRIVTTLTAEELATARPITEAGRHEVANNFDDMLSPNEFKTRSFARILGLKTVGITQFDPIGRSFETRGGRVNMMLDPFTAITGNSPKMSRARLESVFGSVADLLTAAELQDSGVNMYDVTSRLNPGFVLNRLTVERSGARSAARSGAILASKFAFLITEDGQLRIAAHLPDSESEQPDYLRLGQGRRIFVKGIFSVDSNGAVSVTTSRYATHIIGYGENFDFNSTASSRLIAAAFNLQAGRQVLQVDGARPEFLSDGFHSVPSLRGSWSSTDLYDSAKSAWTGVPGSYVPQTSTSRRSNLALPEMQLEWDSSTSAKPLAYSNWLAEMQRLVAPELTENEAAKLLWAHYVLKTNPNMSKDAIQKNWRKLVSRFHTDPRKNSVEDRDDVSNANVARDVIFADLVERGS